MLSTTLVVVLPFIEMDVKKKRLARDIDTISDDTVSYTHLDVYKRQFLNCITPFNVFTAYTIHTDE